MISFELWTMNIKSNIEVFSDLKRQKEAWIYGKSVAGSFCWYEEIIQLLDDSHFEIYLTENQSKIPRVLYEALKKLQIELDLYEGQETDAEILKDPEWHKIVEQAKKVIEIWNKTDSNWILG